MLDGDKPFLSWQLSSETRSNRRVLYVDVTASDTAPNDERILVFRYETGGIAFDDTFTFFIDASVGMSMALEFKDVLGKGGQFVVPLMPSDGFKKVTLDLKNHLAGVDLRRINEVLLHASGSGRIKLDGFLR